MYIGRRRKRQLFSLVFATLIMLPFQNCSRSGQAVNFNSTQVNGNAEERGGGIDGKTFLSYGECEPGKVGVVKTVVVSAAGSKAQVWRENRQNLAQPQDIDPQSLNYLIESQNALVLDGKIFDAQVEAPQQRVTITVCQDQDTNPTVQVSLWENTGDNKNLFGQVALAGGNVSGALRMLVPDHTAPNYFESATGQSSSLRLTLAADNTATVTYSVGAASGSSTLSCYEQSLPPLPSTYVDGSQTAPAGAPQASSLLTAYTFRPSWLVAGVDFAVGIPMGTVLKNPTTISMPGVVLDVPSKVVFIQASNITLDGYDFASAGYVVGIMSGANTVIRNSVVSQIQTEPAAGSITVENCVMDGGGVGSGNYALIYHQGAGSFTARYNWLKNFPQKGFSIGNGPVATVEYNLFQNGNLDGGDKSGIYIGGGTYASIVVAHNTIEHAVGAATSMNEISLGEGQVSYTNADISFNTIITRGTAANPSIQAAMSIGPGPLTPNTDQASVHDNYIDPTGAGGPFYGGISTPLITYSNNTNMVTGALFTTTP